jgi:hypothetical protein
VTATLNSLGMLSYRRPIAANKILSSVLNFNPLKLANLPLTPKNKVIMKSIERTTRALLVNIMKRCVHCPASRVLLTYVEILRPKSTDGYSSSLSVCIVHASKCSMSLIVNVQLLWSRLMALTKPRGGELLLKLLVAHLPCHRFRLAQ